MNPYEILGAAPGDSFESVRERYRRLVRENHPDLATSPLERVAATTRTSAINSAWNIVRDPQRRAAFDAGLRLDQTPRPPLHPGAQTVPNVTVRARTTAPTGFPPANIPRATPGATSGARPSPRPARLGVRRGVAGSKAESSRVPKRRNPSGIVSTQIAEAARLFYGQGRADEAIALCQAILRHDFRNVPARELLGDIYLEHNQPHRALALWEQALMLQPHNPVLKRKILALAPAPNAPTADRGVGRDEFRRHFSEWRPVPGALGRAVENPLFCASPREPARLTLAPARPALWKRVLGRLARR